MKRLNILITGAGIGGNALACWLSKLHHNVTVIERFPELRVNGLQLDLRGYGIQVMRLMGLEEEIRSRLAPEEGMELVDRKGKQWGWFPANKTGKGAQTFTSEFEIMRSDLCQVLHDTTVAGGAKYIFGRYVTAFDESDSGIVTVTYDDGQTQEFDLVVGADGLSSRLRRLMFSGPDASKSKDSLVELNERTGYFTVDKPIQDGEKYIATGYITTGKRFILIRRHSPTKIQVYLKFEPRNVSPEAKESVEAMRKGDVKSEKDAFTKVFEGAGWKADELIKVMQEGAEDWYCQYSGFVRMDSWSQGHVTLVGDAAHGAPADGMGTSAALIGAYILAGEIESHYGKGDDLDDKNASSVDGSLSSSAVTAEGREALLQAIQAYESKHRPYMLQTQKYMSAEPDMWDKIPANGFTVGLMLYLAKFVTALRLDQVLARMAPSEGLKGWELPRYDMVQA